MIKQKILPILVPLAAATQDCRITGCGSGAASCAYNSTLEAFRCRCLDGFTGFPNCHDDIDECSDGHECNSNSSCRNHFGGYTCSCDKGYQKVKNKGTASIPYCEDIDECFQ